MDTTSVSAGYYVLSAFSVALYLLVLSPAVRFVLRFVQAISATESWRYVDGFGCHIGPVPYDTQILFAAHRRPLYPTVALDGPPSIVVYFLVLFPCPSRALIWFRGEEESIAVNRTVVNDP